jgi:hypothetical protein
MGDGLACTELQLGETPPQAATAQCRCARWQVHAQTQLCLLILQSPREQQSSGGCAISRACFSTGAPQTIPPHHCLSSGLGEGFLWYRPGLCQCWTGYIGLYIVKNLCRGLGFASAGTQLRSSEPCTHLLIIRLEPSMFF